MGGMPLNDMPWWRWRSNVRSALHMLSDPAFQQNVWLAGADGYGDVTDAVYRLVEDTWLDNWSAEKYVGTIFRDAQEAALVDTAVLRVLRIMHQVGPDAPVSAYLDQGQALWPMPERAAGLFAAFIHAYRHRHLSRLFGPWGPPLVEMLDDDVRQSRDGLASLAESLDALEMLYV